MKAAVFHKPGDISYTAVPDPRIELATDIILRVTSTAICGSDLHILSGAVPQTTGMIMGHEFMGIADVESQGIHIDVLINNAGQGVYGEFEETDIDRELDIINI